MDSVFLGPQRLGALEPVVLLEVIDVRSCEVLKIEK